MRSLFVVLALVACQRNESKLAPATTGSAAAPVASGSAAPPRPRAAWEQHTNDFMSKFTDAIAAAGGDCEKLAAGIEPLAPAAKALRAEMDAAGKKLAEFVPDAMLMERMAKVMNADPELLDRCEKQSKRVSAALDATLLTIQPFGEATAKAAGDAIGKAAATK